MLIMHSILFSMLHNSFVVAMVMEIVKMLQKLMDPKITQKLFKLA